MTSNSQSAFADVADLILNEMVALLPWLGIALLCAGAVVVVGALVRRAFG